MSFLLLMIAFLMSGLLNIANKMLVQWGLGDFREAYMLTYYGVPTVMGMLYLTAMRDHGDNTDRRVGLVMGACGALSTLCLLIALQRMDGIVAFPVRSLGNLVLTAVVSIIAWKERLSRSQWLGIILSLLAIWLIY